MRTLVLNAGYEPMLLISWEKALCLVLSEKAEVLAEYGQMVRTVSQSFALPSVVRLKRYVRLVKRFGAARCTRKNILLRDRYQCQYCGVHCSSASASIDHIIPRCRGGRTSWDNVVVACHDCNRRKGDKSLAESGFKLMSKPRQPTWSELLGETNYIVEAAWLPYIAAS
jgi:5-methylcytosine-specific restriction endonuclease McrA